MRLPVFEGTSKAGLYGDFMAMVDTMIGRVLKKLDESNMRGIDLGDRIHAVC